MGESHHPIQGEHRYQQEVTSPDEHEERAGRSLVTTDHEVIRRFFQLENSERGG